jgi:hypothetical protein
MRFIFENGYLSGCLPVKAFIVVKKLVMTEKTSLKET